ncbi:MAG: integral rane protein MviN [Candidatus Saccharibacteria bacterium]|nr:integral rane protein MviN [Candidatus Saccharibacteria bacterium]
MNRLLKRANKRISLGGAATLLIVTALFGQLLGILRTKLVNANFDALGPHSTDAYFAAFKIPDFFFFTLAAGALGVAFMPVLADHMQKGDRKGVSELTSSLLTLLAGAMAIVGVIIFVFAEPLIRTIVAPDLSPQQLHNAATIMRLVAFNPLMFTIAGIITSVQQTYGRFFFYAIAPLFYNASIVISIYLFKDNIGLIGLGIGALAGAVLQLAIVMFGMHGAGFKFRPKIKWRNPDFRLIMRQLPARSIDQGVDSINSIAETNFARRLGEGYLSWYENAYILHNAPTLLIGTAIATAAFPRMTDRLAQGRRDLFRKEFLQVLRAMIWIALPVVVVCYFARGYLARLIFAKDAPEIALIFGYLTGAIFFRILYAIISRWFYAQKDTWTPLIISLFTIGLNIYLAYTLSRPDAYGVTGLAMAQSIVAAIEVSILFCVMLVRDHRLFDNAFWGGVMRIFSVTGFSILTAFVMVSVLPLNINDRGFVTLGAKLAAIAAVTFLVHLSISSLFGLEEPRPVIRKARQFARVLLKPVRVD